MTFRFLRIRMIRAGSIHVDRKINIANRKADGKGKVSLLLSGRLIIKITA
jgi:hypothetical protein